MAMTSEGERLSKHDRETVVIALRYGIAHATGTADDDGESASARRRAQKWVVRMQALHMKLTGKEFAA